MGGTIGTITLWQVLGLGVSAAGAIVTIGGAVTMVYKMIKFARQPNIEQNEQIARLAAENEDLRQRVDKIESRFQKNDEGNRVTQRAILALLEHGIDGNNIKLMQEAKAELHNYLIEK